MEIIKGGSHGKLHFEFPMGAKAKQGAIEVLIASPDKWVEIEELTIIGGWLPLQIRPTQKLIIGKLTTVDYMNDGCQICSNEVTIHEFDTYSTLEKVYSPLNHPDMLHIFSWRGEEKVIRNVDIPKFTAYIRNCAEHAGIHLTEDTDYNGIGIGYEFMRADTDATYPYILSANSLRDSVFGHTGMNVSNKNVRIKDVKNTGQPIRGVDVYGIPKKNVYMEGENMNVYV